MKTEERMEKYLNERQPQVPVEGEREKAIKRFDYTMKIVHNFWKRSKGDLDINQLRDAINALEMVSIHVTPRKKRKSAGPGPRL